MAEHLFLSSTKVANGISPFIIATSNTTTGKLPLINIQPCLKEEIQSRHLVTFVFQNENLISVLEAIDKKQEIEGIQILEEIRNPAFRFITPDNQLLSFKLSEALVNVYKQARTLSAETHEAALQKQQENADSFAHHMFEVVQDLRDNSNISTYRDTVRALNENRIPTYRGGEWHLKTLQDLNKRWKNLGLKLNPKQS